MSISLLKTIQKKANWNRTDQRFSEAKQLGLTTNDTRICYTYLSPCLKNRYRCWNANMLHHVYFLWSATLLNLLAQVFKIQCQHLTETVKIYFMSSKFHETLKLNLMNSKFHETVKINLINSEFYETAKSNLMNF